MQGIGLHVPFPDADIRPFHDAAQVPFGAVPFVQGGRKFAVRRIQRLNLVAACGDIDAQRNHAAIRRARVNAAHPTARRQPHFIGEIGFAEIVQPVCHPFRRAFRRIFRAEQTQVPRLWPEWHPAVHPAAQREQAAETSRNIAGLAMTRQSLSSRMITLSGSAKTAFFNRSRAFVALSASCAMAASCSFNCVTTVSIVTKPASSP